MKKFVLMSGVLACIILTTSVLISCDYKKEKTENKDESQHKDSILFKSGYSDVNGIKMYYEIYGQGEPLVLIHGGGSTIQSSFGMIIPHLSENYQIIAIELQNHGRTSNRSVPQTFEQDADDVFTLMKNLGINKASIFGFSNGGQTTLQIGIRHPEMVYKLIVASAPYKRDGFIPGFFDHMMKEATLANMPQKLKDEFLKVTPDTSRLRIMFNKDVERMRGFKDWSDEQIKSIAAPTLLINGDTDVITPEHAVAMHRLIAHSQLAILPGGHGKYMGEVTTLSESKPFFDFCTPLIEEFLNTN